MGSRKGSMKEALLSNSQSGGEESKDPLATATATVSWWSGSSADGCGGGFRGEVKRLSQIAGPMVAVILSQYLVQVVSVMMVGHLGELSLSSTSIAMSLAGVTGFSFIVSLSIHSDDF